MTSIGNFGNNNRLRLINQNTEKLNSSFEKLSSGLRINRAKDDAAGLAVAQQLLADGAQRSVGSRNARDGVSLAEIADGSLSQLSDINARLGELATQAANGTLSDEQRGALNSEFQQLTQEADRIVSTTSFNGRNVFDSSTTIATGDGSQITLTSPDVSAALTPLLSANISSASGAQAALEATKSFSDSVASKRGELGAGVSRLETAIRNNDVASENIAAASSRIRDLDVASETARNTGLRILQEASTALGAQANLAARNVLRLLG